METIRMLKQMLIAAGIGCCAVSPALQAGSLDPVIVDSPLTLHSELAPIASRDFATRLHIDFTKLESATNRQFVFIENFPLDQHRRVTLQLEEGSAIASDATLVVMQHDDKGKLIEVERSWPKCHVFNGTVMGEPDSDVFLAIGEEIANGWISIDGTRFVIGTRFSDRMTLLYDQKNVPDGMIKWEKYVCNVTASKDDIPRPAGGGNRGGEECPQAKIAIDTDFEFTNNEDNFDGSETAAANYVNALVSAVSGIYRSAFADFYPQGVQLKVQYLRLWAVNDDSYPGSGSTDEYMAIFRDHWETNMGHVDRHMAHLICGADLGGGLAAGIGVLCTNAAYAVSGGLASSFDPLDPLDPLEDEQPDNWDPIVFAHETGHVFGMIHTHDPLWGVWPPTEDEDNPDLCGNDECDNASGAPIMSYCHLCEPDFIANIAMEFDEGNVERASILISLGDCDFGNPQEPPTITDDHTVTDVYTPVQIHVLDNDIPNDCNNEVYLVSFDERGVRGGVIAQIGDDILLYTPTGFITGNDSFTYTAQDGSGNQGVGNVVVLISRPPPGGGGGVDPNDVWVVITQWGTSRADVNGDGVTDVKDLLAVLSGDAKPIR